MLFSTSDDTDFVYNHTRSFKCARFKKFFVSTFRYTSLCANFNIFFTFFLGVKEWIRKNLRFSPEEMALLVWDSFRGHLTEGVKALLARRNVDVAVIPGGLTPVLQPLDKCINKPFKTKVRVQYQAWVVNGPFTYTLSGKKRPPSKELVLQWIHRAWQEIPAELIAHSFKSCGNTNNLDGTEDEAVWEEETGNAEENGDDEVLDNEFETDSESDD